jgi:hypothetical protein
VFRPIIIVAIDIGAQSIRVPALVDSGADNTLVPAAFIAPLGVDFAKLPAGHRLDVTEIALSIALWQYFLQYRWTMLFRSLTLPEF